MNENALFTLIYLALFLLIVGGFSIFWLRRPRNHSTGERGLRLIQRLPLGQREQVVLIDVAGERLLLGVTSNEIQLLCTVRCNAELDESGTKVQIDRMRSTSAVTPSDKRIVNS